MPDRARLRYGLERTLVDSGLRLAVLASEASDRGWRWKNQIAGRMVTASALGGPVPLLDIPSYPVTIFARAGHDAERLELWHWHPDDGGSGFDPRNFSPLDLAPAPMFGPRGLQMFMTPDLSGDKHYFVRAHYPNGRTRDSDLILAKIDSRPTERRPGALRVSHAGPLEFSWPRFTQPGLWISFLMVLEGPERNLVTGVYSWDTRWTFPTVRHVPFFYHQAEPPPALTPGRAYEALYVAIDADRWIRYADSLSFVAQ